MTGIAVTAPRGFEGQFVVPTDGEYERLRFIHDERFDRRPAAIARCTGAEDVRRALALARDRGLEIAVRSGGHGFHGFGTTEGGIVLDLRPMNDVRVDRSRATVRIGPGALTEQIIRTTAPLDVAPVGGSSVGVGFGGLAIFSGQNYLSPQHGNACDNLVAAEVVLADGSAVRASESENADLFWAIRGAGDNMGVVTSYVARLHSVPLVVTTGSLSWRLDEARQALLGIAELDPSLGDELWWGLRLEDDGGEPVVGIWYYHLGTPATADRDIARLEALAPLRGSTRLARSYLDVHLEADLDLHGRRGYVAACDLEALDARTVDVLLDIAHERAARPAVLRARRVVGAYPYRKALSAPVSGSAFNRYRGLVFLAECGYDDPAEQEGHEEFLDWAVHRLVNAGLTISGYNGVPINFISRVDAEIVERSFGTNLDRLRELKRRFDPDDFFCRSIPLDGNRPA